VTEALAFLGVEDSLVGVSAFCAKPESIRSKRKVGSYNTVDRKVLDELRPEVIFTVTGYQREFAVRLGKELRCMPVELPVSIYGIVDMVVKLGLIVNEPDRATSSRDVLWMWLPVLKPVQERSKYTWEGNLGGPCMLWSLQLHYRCVKVLVSRVCMEIERVNGLRRILLGSVHRSRM